jgi:hypothetical protein
MQHHRQTFKESNVRPVITQMCAENTQGVMTNKKTQNLISNALDDDSFSIQGNINPNLIRSETLETINGFLHD